jgi:acyl carrier protein
MTRAELREAVLKALVSVVPEANPAEIRATAPLREELDIDSMDFINFVISLHEAVGVDVPEADYGQLSTLDACLSYLARRLGMPAEAP